MSKQTNSASPCAETEVDCIRITTKDLYQLRKRTELDRPVYHSFLRYGFLHASNKPAAIQESVCDSLR